MLADASSWTASGSDGSIRWVGALAGGGGAVVVVTAATVDELAEVDGSPPPEHAVPMVSARTASPVNPNA